MKHKKRIIALAVVLMLCIGGWAYVADYYHVDETAIAAMASASDITVQQSGSTLAFVPEQVETGFIFYPGGKVEYTAYAPLMRALAENGVLCVLTEMPMNLAGLNMNAASGIFCLPSSPPGQSSAFASRTARQRLHRMCQMDDRKFPHPPNQTAQAHTLAAKKNLCIPTQDEDPKIPCKILTSSNT